VPKRSPNINLSTEEWKGIIDRLASWGICATTIVGGEPTTRSDLPELIFYLRNKSILPCLISNFTLLNYKMIDTFATSGLFWLQASIDSLRGHGRGKESWLDLLSYARRVGILPMVSTLVTAQNVDEVPYIAKEVTGRGIIFNCSLYQEVGGEFSVVVNGLKPKREEVISTFRRLEVIKRQTGLIRTTYNYLRNVERFYYDGLYHCDPRKEDWVNVSADGMLMPCQEYLSTVGVLDITSLRDPRWLREREAMLLSCKGCYYQCYYEQNTLGWHSVLNEMNGIISMFKVLSQPLKTSKKKLIIPYNSVLKEG